MNLKTLSAGLIIALFAAIFAAAMAVTGVLLLNKDEQSKAAFFQLFSKSEKHAMEFVEIKNVVIALKASDKSERYLLLELALVSDDAKNSKLLEEMSPLIRGTTVNLFSEMDYQQVRSMGIETLRGRLVAAYSERFKQLNGDVPFQDVIISKLLFQ